MDTSPHKTSRLKATREELAELIRLRTPRDGRLEVQPGLFLNRVSTPDQPVYSVLQPSFCVIAQGSKDIFLGDQRFRYDTSHYLITTLGVPASGQVIQATRQHPYLGFRLVLDPALITSVLIDSAPADSRSDGSHLLAVNVSPIHFDLLDATLRLVRLIDRPFEYRALAPLIVREIIFRLLHGAQASRLRQLATFGGQSHRMARAVETLRQNFDKPLRIDSVAKQLGMSVSGFHSHFKSVTTLSPLQFQKQLRLQEARRLMLSENLDARQAGFRVGYDDPSHFTREYKRHFGHPPLRDIERLREVSSA